MKKEIKRCRAPVRIDFAGGWTDVPHTIDWGAVLNGAIAYYITVTQEEEKYNRPSDGIFFISTAEPNSNIPPGAGLGGSSSYRVAKIALDIISNKKLNDELRRKVAETAYNYERYMGVICGKQDQ